MSHRPWCAPQRSPTTPGRRVRATASDSGRVHVRVLMKRPPRRLGADWWVEGTLCGPECRGSPGRQHRSGDAASSRRRRHLRETARPWTSREQSVASEGRPCRAMPGATTGACYLTESTASGPPSVTTPTTTAAGSRAASGTGSRTRSAGASSALSATWSRTPRNASSSSQPTCGRSR